jgi:ABC-type multidrug transport system fused ATPase/permease subunit
MNQAVETQAEQTRSTWRRLRSHLGGYWRVLTLLGVVSLAAALLEAASLATLAPLVAAISAGNQEFSWNVGAWGEVRLGAATLFFICLSAVVGRSLTQLVVALLDTHASGHYLAASRKRLLTAFLQASWARQAEERVGHLQLLLTDNVSFGLNCLRAFVQMLVSGCNFLILLSASLLIESLASVMLIAASAVLFFVLRPLSNFARRNARKKSSLNVSFSGAVNETVSLAKEIRVYGAQDRVRERLYDDVERIRRKRAAALLAAAVLPIVYQFTVALIVLAGLAWVYFGDLTNLTGLAASAMLLVRAFSYSQSIQVSWHQIVESIPYLDQLERAGRLYDSSATSDGGEPIDGIHRLAFDEVSFNYREDRPALHGVSFEIERGEAVGIVGPSGSGKSTLIQILLRLRDPDTGRLSVNGRNADDFSQASWYQAMSLVPQEPLLISDTVAENIRFYRPGMSMERIEAAARQAGIHDEILRLPQGYETPVGERGGRLSGGQRQRICIARALAGDPQVIIFDEPTSALDVHSEACIQESLRMVKGSVTLFIVAHRLSTLNICDKVMVLRDGRLQSFGPPKQLAETDSYYSEALRLARVD